MPPYRETRDYIAKIKSTGPVKPSAPSTRVFSSTEVVDGREVTRLSNTPAPQGDHRQRPLQSVRCHGASPTQPIQAFPASTHPDVIYP